MGEERTISFKDNMFSVREDIPGVLVFQAPNGLANHPQRIQGILNALQRALIGAGVNMPLVMIPSDVRFAKFRECDAERVLELDRLFDVKKQADLEELQPDTKTMGSA